VGLAAKPVLVFANSAGTPAIVRGAILQVTAIGGGAPEHIETVPFPRVKTP
jgi:hypothetical protein